MLLVEFYFLLRRLNILPLRREPPQTKEGYKDGIYFSRKQNSKPLELGNSEFVLLAARQQLVECELWHLVQQKWPPVSRIRYVAVLDNVAFGTRKTQQQVNGQVTERDQVNVRGQ